MSNEFNFFVAIVYWSVCWYNCVIRRDIRIHFALSVCETIGAMVSHWELPLLPVSCSGESLTNRTQFPTLIRIGVTQTAQGQSLLELFRQVIFFVSVSCYKPVAVHWEFAVFAHSEYGWRKVVVITGPNSCQTVTDGIRHRFIDGGVEVSEYIPVRDELTEDEIRQYLDRVRRRGRSKSNAIVPMALMYESKLKM